MVGLFCLFMVNSSIAMTHDMSPTDCPMKVSCHSCVVFAAADFSDPDLVFPPVCNVPVAFEKFDFIFLNPVYHPPRQ